MHSPYLKRISMNNKGPIIDETNHYITEQGNIIKIKTVVIDKNENNHSLAISGA